LSFFFLTERVVTTLICSATISLPPSCSCESCWFPADRLTHSCDATKSSRNDVWKRKRNCAATNQRWKWRQWPSMSKSKDNSRAHFLLLAHLKTNIYNGLAIRLAIIFFSSLYLSPIHLMYLPRSLC
jgi:hypothetical protein